MGAKKLSVIVVAYDMAREIPRTVRSLSPAMQRGIAPEDYEIIVVDNGSKNPFSEEDCRIWGGDQKFVYVENPTCSPVPAVNKGLALAQGEVCGVLIDGARMVTPGLLASVVGAARTHARPVIATVGFHLGPDHQSRSVASGYNQQVEDMLLTEVDWSANGYRLFDIAVFAGSSINGWFTPMTESNALFLTREMWAELGGCDPRFVSPGGGLVNLDTYVRACTLQGVQNIVVLGEGTFHQIHGGITANSTNSRWKEFHDEYVRIRGKPYAVPDVRPYYYGKLDQHSLPFMAFSAQRAANLTRN